MAAPRSIAAATVSFGLVSIPVKLYTTSQTSEQVSFRMLHSKCNTPVKYRYWCPTDEEMVERDGIVKGYEYAKDEYVIFTPEEVKSLEEESTKAIVIEEFVHEDLVDPVYFEKAYYLGPDKGGNRAYQLLSKALREKELVGIATYATRGKQQIVALRPIEGGLVLQQLHYATEVRPFSDIDLEGQGDVREAELKLAFQLIEHSISGEFRPEKYKDESRQRFQAIVEKKLEGQDVAIAPAETPHAKVIDLMEALKESLAQKEAPITEAKPAARSQTQADQGRKPAKAAPRVSARKEKASTPQGARKRTSA
jgi:DNA end-binding protein Ku